MHTKKDIDKLATPLFYSESGLGNSMNPIVPLFFIY